MENLKFSWKSACRPSSLHFSSLPGISSAGLKIPKKWLRGIGFWKIFVFFSNRLPQSQGNIWEIIFRRKILRRLDLCCLSFSCLSALEVKWNQKPKNEKVCWGSVGCWVQFLIFLARHDHKNATWIIFPLQPQKWDTMLKIFSVYSISNQSVIQM